MRVIVKKQNILEFSTVKYALVERKYLSLKLVLAIHLLNQRLSIFQ